MENSKPASKPKNKERTFIILTALIVLGVVSGFTILNSIPSGGHRDPVTIDWAKAQRGITNIKAASETYYSENNFNYALKLNEIFNFRNESRLSQETLRWFSDQGYNNFDYCVTGDRQNYALGIQLKIPKRSPYTYMNSSVLKAQMPCLPNLNKTCGIDNYYCVINPL